MPIESREFERMKFLSKKASKGPWTYSGKEVEDSYEHWVARRVLNSDHDVEFIAKSRSFIPKVIKEIESLEDENKKLKEEVDSLKRKLAIAKDTSILSDIFGVDSNQNRKIASVIRKLREL